MLATEVLRPRSIQNGAITVGQEDWIWYLVENEIRRVPPGRYRGRCLNDLIELGAAIERPFELRFPQEERTLKATLRFQHKPEVAEITEPDEGYVQHVIVWFELLYWSETYEEALQLLKRTQEKQSIVDCHFTFSLQG